MHVTPKVKCSDEYQKCMPRSKSNLGIKLGQIKYLRHYLIICLMKDCSFAFVVSEITSEHMQVDLFLKLNSKIQVQTRKISIVLMLSLLL